MKKYNVLLWVLLIIANAVPAQNSDEKETMQELIDRQFEFAKQQYKVLSKNVPDNRMPKTFEEGEVKTSSTRWWCSGFYPGTLLYIYENTKDSEILSEAEKRLSILEKEKHFKGHHDLGFMMFCSFGNAYRILKKPKFKPTIDTSAQSLATRYRPNAKVIQSWNSGRRYKGPVIIDNMMNLELLNWVSANGGDSKFGEIAVEHANTTLKNHFRKDYSSYHVVDYNMETGEVVKKVTHQGADDESAWSRGQGWALYGYTMMYRFTKDKAYLKQAKGIAKFILDHPNLPQDKVPYWDFNAPDIPNAYRDDSAAALIASALLELGQYTTGKKKRSYIAAAEKMLQSLSSDKYRSKLGENGGFILTKAIGNRPKNTEINVPLTYADYYFVEALSRYKQWYL